MRQGLKVRGGDVRQGLRLSLLDPYAGRCFGILSTFF